MQRLMAAGCGDPTATIAARRRPSLVSRGSRSRQPRLASQESPSAGYADAVVPELTVVEVVDIQEPAPGDGRRRVTVRWSDGSVGHGLSYDADEVLMSEGDMVGRTASELRALHFARDREHLRRDD
jgi:hypothetical protein